MNKMAKPGDLVEFWSRMLLVVGYEYHEESESMWYKACEVGTSTLRIYAPEACGPPGHISNIKWT